MDWIRSRLTQPTTWRGIIGLLTALGFQISPEYQEAIITLGLALIGIINIVVDERKAARKAAATVASRVATDVAADVAQDTAKTAVEQNLPWLTEKPVTTKE